MFSVSSTITGASFKLSPRTVDFSLPVAFDNKDASRVAFLVGEKMSFELTSAIFSSVNELVERSRELASRVSCSFETASAAKKRAKIAFEKIFQKDISSDSLSEALSGAILARKQADEAADEAVEAAQEAIGISRFVNRSCFRAKASFSQLRDIFELVDSSDTAAILSERIRSIDVRAQSVLAHCAQCMAKTLAVADEAAQCAQAAYIIGFRVFGREDILNESCKKATEMFSVFVKPILGAINSVSKVAGSFHAKTDDLSGCFKGIFATTTLDLKVVTSAVCEFSKTAQRAALFLDDIDKKAMEVDHSSFCAELTLVENKAASVVASWVKLPDNSLGEAIDRLAKESLCTNQVLRGDMDLVSSTVKGLMRLNQQAAIAADSTAFFVAIAVAISADLTTAIAEAVSDVADAALAEIHLKSLKK